MKDNLGFGPLYVAAEAGHLEVVKILLSTKDIDVNLTCAYWYTPFDVGEEEEEYGYYDEEAQYVEPVYKISTPLHKAVEGKHLEIVKLLLECTDIQLNLKDEKGFSPLDLAIFLGRADIVKTLVQHKDIQVNTQDEKGFTILHLAVKRNHVEVVKALISDKYIQVNLQDKDGRTPLHLAVKGIGTIEIVEALLEHKNIQVNLEDKNGYTPLDEARKIYGIGGTSKARLLLKSTGIQVSFTYLPKTSYCVKLKYLDMHNTDVDDLIYEWLISKKIINSNRVYISNE